MTGIQRFVECTASVDARHFPPFIVRLFGCSVSAGPPPRVGTRLITALMVFSLLVSVSDFARS